MDVPTLISASWTFAARSTKSHDCWAITSGVGLQYAYPEQSIGYIHRIPMGLISVYQRASRPKQLADLWPLEEAFRFCTNREDCGPLGVEGRCGELQESERPWFIAEKVEAVNHSRWQDVRHRFRYLCSIVFQSRTEWLSKRTKLGVLVGSEFHESANLQGNTTTRFIMRQNQPRCSQRTIIGTGVNAMT